MSTERPPAVGITGTRKGPTEAQKDALDEMLGKVNLRGDNPYELHHGDCKGVDEFANQMGWLHDYCVVSHPPADSRFRAYCVVHEELDPSAYLTRNRAIVASVEYLIAVPADRVEINSDPWKPGDGGTMFTIKHALKEGLPVRVVWPDGEVQGYGTWDEMPERVA